MLAMTVAQPTKRPPIKTFAISPNRACWNIIRKPAQMMEIEQITPPTPSNVVWIVLSSVLTWESCAHAGTANIGDEVAIAIPRAAVRPESRRLVHMSKFCNLRSIPKYMTGSCSIDHYLILQSDGLEHHRTAIRFAPLILNR
ncbi:hypothetical protein QF002_004936 [Paraburkholderia youngii]